MAVETRIKFTHGQFGVYQHDAEGRQSILATFSTLAAAQEAYPGATPDPNMTSAAAASQRFRGVDWVALGSLALTVVLAIIIIAGLKTALIPFDVLNAMSTGVWLVAICGPVAGIVALSESKGRPKWPGVLALFSPVVAGFGSLLAFAIVWSGNT